MNQPCAISFGLACPACLNRKFTTRLASPHTLSASSAAQSRSAMAAFGPEVSSPSFASSASSRAYSVRRAMLKD